MEMKVEIISNGNIKPSTPTPDHLRNHRMCLMDELAPPSYVPILLFYSSDEFGSNYNGHYTSILEKLKSSLSETLSRFYPLCGTLKGNASLECNDNGVLFVETNVNVSVSEIVKNPEAELLYKLFPFNPYHRPKTDQAVRLLGVQVNVFSCGGVGIGVCISHKIADGTTTATFLNAWAATATGADLTQAPRLDSAEIFPPKGVDLSKQREMIRKDKIVTKRFKFSGENIASLKSKIGTAVGKTSRVEAVTALIWKSAMEAAKHNSGKDVLPPAIATHAVDLRGRSDPPLPENLLGNIWRLAIAPYKDAKEGVELHELVKILKAGVQKFDNGYVNELKGENGFDKAMETTNEMRESLIGGGALEVYVFSSWTRFPLYEVDFGWGRPVKVCTITLPLNNVVVLMGTKSGDGIEAWVNLAEDNMKEFESNEELLQFVSTNNA